MSDTKFKSAAEWKLESVQASIRRICRAWTGAIEAAAAVGYPVSSDGPSGTGISDPTGSIASSLAGKHPDIAGRWLIKARRTLADLLVNTDATRARGERRWNGPFDPRRLVETFCMAAQELSELNDKGVNRLFTTIIDLGNEAANQWPDTPKVGTTVDGVKVGKRSATGETCTGCGRYASGDATDPILRIDGQPYHRAPCYNTAKRKAARAKVAQ
jgi:hypothetical protein